MIRILACVGLSLSLLASGHSEELIWDTLPLVGVAELSNGKPADGVVYLAQQHVEKALPEFEHRYVVSAPNRVTREMASGVPRCSTLTVRHPERDRVGYFIAFLPTLPMQLIIRAEQRTTLSLQGGTISLQSVLRSSHLKGAISTTRGYPPDLQQLIEGGLNAGHITAINSNSSGSNLLSMVSHRRLDYTLEFPIVVKRFSETTPLPSELLGIPITENTHLSPAGIYCTRSPWGKAMALRLDKVIRQIAANADQLLPLYRATTDASTFEYFEPQIRTWLKQRSQTRTEL